MSSKKVTNVLEVIERLKKASGCSNDAALARLLGVGGSRISMWKKRGVIDLMLIVQKIEQINTDWLLNGTGEMLEGKTGGKQAENERSTAGKDDGGEVSILHLLPERLLQALNDYEKRSDVYMMPALGPQMTPEKIKEGDILLIDPKQEAVEGDWILISTDTGPSIQRYNPSATSLGVVIKLIREPAILRR